MTSTILITGASSGIGRATALHFHQQGWNVIASMRSPEQAKELASLERVLVTRLDVIDEESIAAAIAATLERFGGIDVLINNAGFGAYGPLEVTALEVVRRQIDTNVIGLLAVSKAVLPLLRQRGGGVIVNISTGSPKSLSRQPLARLSALGSLGGSQRPQCPTTTLLQAISPHRMI
jgi:NAD(P)-dependent dehydrogenase (short-subunit alcohol dehydrogenase family)